MKFILFLFGLLICIGSIFLQEDFVFYLYEHTFLNWSLAGAFPYLGIFLLFLVALLKTYNRQWHLFIAIASVALVGTMVFYRSPIYTNDWKNEFDNATEKENLVIQSIVKQNPDFSGMVVLASPYCSYCHELTNKAYLTAQKKEIPLLVYLNQTDTNGRSYFLKYTPIHEKSLHHVPDISAMQALTLSWYPVLIEFRKGEPYKRWWYRNFGYPALDDVLSE